MIVNQINSSNPSQLGGYIEVAGRRAEVIMANPAGIQVNGGGFINAAGITLTSGRPIINNGHLEGFRVRSGSVNVSGNGLDVRRRLHPHSRPSRNGKCRHLGAGFTDKRRQQRYRRQRRNNRRFRRPVTCCRRGRRHRRAGRHVCRQNQPHQHRKRRGHPQCRATLCRSRRREPCCRWRNRQQRQHRGRR